MRCGVDKMVVTLALIPAFSPRRRRNIRRFLGMSGVGVGRSVIELAETSRYAVLSLGRGNR
jgi:hypothetical protein